MRCPCCHRPVDNPKVLDGSLFFFDEEKSLQTIAYILFDILNKPKIEVKKLLILIYLIDRKRLQETQYMVTFDQPFADEDGIFPRHLFHILTKDSIYWDNYLEIKEIKNKFSITETFVSPKSQRKDFKSPDSKTIFGRLSQYDENIIRQVYYDCGDCSTEELQEYIKQLPEYKNYIESEEYEEKNAWFFTLEELVEAIGKQNIYKEIENDINVHATVYNIIKDNNEKSTLS